MTPDEQHRFTNMEKDVKEILRALIGDSFTEIPGLIKDMKDMKSEVTSIKEQFKKARFIVYGLGIGFAAGGTIFGFVSGKVFIEWIKKILL